MSVTAILASTALLAHLLDGFGFVPPLRSAPPSGLFEVPMFPSVHAAFVSFTSRFEGSTDFMYLDDLGLVTVGKGNLIDRSLIEADFANASAPALELLWFRADGRQATPDEVRAEWQRVKALQPMRGSGGGAFARGAKLHATAGSIAKLIEKDLEENEAELRKVLTEFATYPADAQLAIHDMAWAMGAEFTNGYPHWTEAVQRGDWTTAAAECAIAHPRNTSIDARNAANKVLFANAAAVVVRGLPRETLYYPRDLSRETLPPPPPPTNPNLGSV